MATTGAPSTVARFVIVIVGLLAAQVLSAACGDGGCGCFQAGDLLQGPSVQTAPGSTGAQIAYVTCILHRWSNG